MNLIALFAFMDDNDSLFSDDGWGTSICNLVSSMTQLLEVFGVVLNKNNKFDFNDQTYQIMFEWKDGICSKAFDINKNKISNEIDDIESREREIEQINSSSNMFLQVPKITSDGKKDALFKSATFLESSKKLIKKDESLEMQSAYQQAIKGMVDAYIMLDKERKLKEQRMHLAFMFSSPLLIYYQSQNSQANNQNKSASLMMIDHEREFREIQNSLEQTKIKMNYYKVCACTDNLTSVLLTNPRVLHFSGHGVKNNVEEIGTEVALRRNQGDLLVFENKTGCAELVSEMMLKELLKQCKTEIDLVFVSSCHSEFIGDIFFKAGINHVICIKESKTISDEASIIFAKAFYQALFSLNSYSICEAFEAAKGAVKLQGGISCNAGEHHKYILKCRHKDKCQNFESEFRIGKSINMSNNPIFNILPTKVENFIGRSIECQKLVELIHSNRLISVTGISGIGKSAIVKEVTHFLSKRDFTKDGTIYLSLVDCQTIDNMFQRIVFLLRKSLLAHDIFINQNMNSEIQFPEYIRLIKDKEVLIILDNCDLIVKQDIILFSKLVGEFLDKVPKSKIIISCEVSIGQINDITEKCFEIKGLSCFDSYQLLKSNTEATLKMNSDSELIELIKDMNK